jgi:DNA (cytosine-5)-methyltransferase 1
MKKLTTLEICAGAGGQALGLEQAGIEHVALVELATHACSTLRLNRPRWNEIQQDIQAFDATPYRGVDIVSGGLPCPPFSVAGREFGSLKTQNRPPLPRTLGGSQVWLSGIKSNLSRRDLISVSAKAWQSV